MANRRADGGAGEWSPIFYPKAFVQERPNLLLADHRLDMETLAHYGALISQERERILLRAA